MCRYLEIMIKSYKSKFRFNLDSQAKDDKNYHKVIAALICDVDGNPYVAVMGTGTHKNDTKECKKEFICDGHAESICYEVAPLYFQEQMLMCNEENTESIFTYDSKCKYYTLKPGVKFHLVVTEPPCGFIRDNNNSCMEWKRAGEHVPHIPTCSSRILIAERMGIQGYVSHLLDKPICVETITILFDIESDDNRKKQKIDFANIPIIQTMEYKSSEFNGKDIRKFKPMNLEPGSKCSDNSSSEGYRHCHVAVHSGDKQMGHIILKYDAKGGEQTDFAGKENFSCNERKIFDELQSAIDERCIAERKTLIKDEYLKLKGELNLHQALTLHRNELSNEIHKHKSNISEKKSAVINHITSQLDKFDNHTNLTKVTESIKGILNDYKRFISCLISIEKAESVISKCLNDESKIVMDCSWEAYFESNSGVQVTEHEP